MNGDGYAFHTSLFPYPPEPYCIVVNVTYLSFLVVVDTVTPSLLGHPSQTFLTLLHPGFSYSVRLKWRGLRMALRVISRDMGILDFKVILECYVDRGDIRLVGVTIIREYTDS